MAIPEPVLAHYKRQQRLTAATLIAARSSWGQLDPASLDRSWATTGTRVLALTAAAQGTSATNGARYIPQALDEMDINAPAAGRVTVGQLVGVASDGRSLDSLLYEPVIRTKALMGDGASTNDAMAGGLASLERIVATQLADAGRAAASVAIAARPRVGWVRMLQTPSCARCAVLAGKFFRWNQGFQRHPRCDCVHAPSTENLAGDLTTDPRKAIESGQVTGLSRADTKAITEGADIGQVVNSRRRSSGMTTTEGTTRRGFAGKRLQGRTRLTPDGIYKQAATREEAIELLRHHGYLI